MDARKVKRPFASLTSGAAVGLLGIAAGGTASAQPAAPADGASAPESIVVTARRREENLPRQQNLWVNSGSGKAPSV